MFDSLFTGLLLGFSLIIAIGPQNIFVLRQGLLKKNVFLVASFCSISDILLIFIGIGGISLIFENIINSYSDFLFGISALWLLGYGMLRLFSSLKNESKLKIDTEENGSALSILFTLFIITFANPHVYLDTVILIGSVSQQFSGNEKYMFGMGSSIASIIFFFSLAYGAKLIVPVMENSSSWRILDFFIGVIMSIIAFNLILEISYFH
mgnify:CR=1 FL=1|tara:strand:- start:71 stop:694 length:624 start_codon:yes stop_codon:yes gene_type:complete